MLSRIIYLLLVILMASPLSVLAQQKEETAAAIGYPPMFLLKPRPAVGAFLFGQRHTHN